jgi:hypothetical protein
VRRQATGFCSPTLISPPPTFETAVDTIEGQSPTAEPLQIDTKPVEAGLASPREISPRGRPRARREAREQMFFGSQSRFASPEGRFCDGWCKPSDEPYPNVVSIGHLLLLGNSELHVCRPALAIRLLGLATRMGRA